MPKYLIVWDCGYGKNTQVRECADQEEASKEAYDAWRECAEAEAEYYAERLTKDLAEDYDKDWP